LNIEGDGWAGMQMDGLQASTLIQQMYAPDDRPRIIAVSADTLQARPSLPIAPGGIYGPFGSCSASDLEFEHGGCWPGVQVLKEQCLCSGIEEFITKVRPCCRSPYPAW
jgi:CheY-like chemotaxis protein